MKKARTTAKKLYNLTRVIGSLVLLREGVRRSSITCVEANLIYLLMKSRGAFLPFVDEKYLCN